ncbi:MAG TPA: hybrid sensor histidine kinase/response regulator [Candidatus Binatia bacterium]|nr:hybrid sensor histidine kinase/response regulator [Candidatus Binatia bacterium]
MDLFRIEAENQSQVLTQSLLALEREPTAAAQLESCMRAAHSLKGAARIIGLQVGVTLAHALEDCFVAAQKKQILLGQGAIDLLLKGVDLLGRIAQTPEAQIAQWAGEKRGEVDGFLAQLKAVREGAAPAPAPAPAPVPTAAAPAVAQEVAVAPAVAAAPAPTAGATTVAEPLAAPTAAPVEGDRVLRVTADSLNRLLGLTGESLVESRWLGPFGESLLRLKRRHHELARALSDLRETLPRTTVGEQSWTLLGEAQRRAQDCEQQLGQRLSELETFGRRSANLSHRLYGEALACRMRPFAEGVRGFPRMVRDLARTLGKQVRLEIIGESTQVDRDILEQLEAPLGHLLRNALDHGIGTPAERRKSGRPAEGLVRIEARHAAGHLEILVSDDGRGVDLAKLRTTVVERRLTTADTAQSLSEAELLEFLFLPGFSMKGEVTDISGRGVGLDVVQTMVKHVRGSVRIQSRPGEGTRFVLSLPLTLSVARTVLAAIGGEPYAFPLAYIQRTLKVPVEKIESIEGRAHFSLDGKPVGLVPAHQVLGGAEPRPQDGAWAVVVIGDGARRYGLVVDHFLGGRELVVQRIDARLGKVKDVSAAALMEDGAPVLIVDAEDLLRSVEKLVASGRLGEVQGGTAAARGQRTRKRVLVVEDSLTVRELERKLLEQRGYEVEVAVDGMDGWNAVRGSHFDLVITDIDMPRMDGIELTSLVKKDARLKAMPVMIVSYKDREEDRRRGLDAGADYYLTKGSFHDETLLQAVMDLIGEHEK